MKALVVLAVLILVAFAQGIAVSAPAFTDTFPMDKADLASTGSNPYFILEPGYQTAYQGGGTLLVITVLVETKMVDGVQTRVVEERESENGSLVEVSRNYFAISKKNNSVFYFGEDVDMYKNGKVVNHEGSWQAGKNGARAGLMVPGIALVGSRYYQEVAPKVAMDRAEVLSVTDTLKTPAGTFTKVVKTEETTPLEPGAKEYKYYAPGVGLINDGDLVLTQHGFGDQ